MDLPDRQEFELDMPGLVELAGLARCFLKHVIAFADFSPHDSAEILDGAIASLRLVEDALELADDVDLPIQMRAVVDAADLEILICEHGFPLDEKTVEKKGDSEREPAVSKVFDHCCWIQRKGGSELHLRRRRPHPAIETLLDVEQRISEQHLEEAEHGSESDPDDKYEIRVFQPSDALEISRRMYESYGRSYPNPDMYYPDRITALNRSGRLRSIVAQAPDGEVVGHYAIERPNLQNIGESGIAVVDVPHRGHGLFTKMHACLVEEAKRAELVGIWSQPTARHPYTQRMNLSHGSTPCGLTLGTTPAQVALRGNANEHNDLRYSCFLYWFPLIEEEPIALSVPAEFEELVRAIYAERGRTATIDSMCKEPRDSNGSNEQGVRVHYSRARNSGTIEIERIDTLTLPLVRSALTMLEEIVEADMIYLDVPITDPCCAWLATELKTNGVILSGIGPRFLGEDSLRLQKLCAPVDLDGMVVEGELGSQIAQLVVSSAGA